MKRNAIVSVAGALMLASAAWSTPAMAQAPQSEVREDLRQGDRVERHGVAVQVGPRGTWTSAHATRLDGEHSMVHVLTRPDGAVVVTTEEEDSGAAQFGAAPELPGSGSPDPCQDSAYNLLKWSFSSGQKSFKWKARFDWYFKANSTPGNVSVSQARAKFNEATGNITASRNDCGLADEVTATHSNVGDTTAGTDFNSNGEMCDGYGAIDDKSVAGWGAAPDGVLGIACTWGTWNGTDTYATAEQSDVRLNPNYNWYGSTVPTVCSTHTGAIDNLVASRYFSIEGVMTHERGHSFGVGHVAEDTHGNLTMSTAINAACQDQESTLGLGDIRALRTLY